MPGGSGAQKRSHALAIRFAKLRDQGLSLGEIAEATGVDRDKIKARIELGKRLKEADHE
ncbi:hypothetical protein [Pseudomonas sp.]|uniref:hypothetical protein n=1 Tax=Pseudomonas sp. TaxID=306 RepID=UPI00258B4BA6|nr:hypothetical protein [Pseudomonas sp.]